MPYLMFVVVKIVRIALYASELILFLSALLSFIGFDDDHFLLAVIFDTADFILMPIRYLCDKSDYLSSLPIDVSYIFAYLIIELLMAFMPTVLI